MESDRELPNIFLTGGAWITAAGRGTLGAGESVAFSADPAALPVIPPSKEIFSERVARFGRYDELTKLGCACVSLALRDAGLFEHGGARRPIGIVTSSRLECLQTDLDYYQSAQEEGGALASPNLFSYTLPGIMSGECAVNFKLAGPTLCVGEEGGRGLAALRHAVAVMSGGLAARMIAGWVDWFADPNEAVRLAPEFVSGAAFVVLEAGEEAARRVKREFPKDLAEIQGIFDLFTAVI